MIHVCFALRDETGKNSKFVGTSMLSIFENNSKPVPSITVHILHDNTLTDDNRNKFNYLAGRYGQLVKFYNVEEICADKIEEIKSRFADTDKSRFNVAAFYKFFIPQVLSSDILKAIYIETNSIVNLDISKLWAVELGDKILGVVPALAIGSDIHMQSKLVNERLIKAEDYFDCSVLLMNLKALRTKEETITAGMDFIKERNYRSLLDTSVLNYCFSLQTVKLPAQFNQFVRWARRNKEPLMKKIYNYTGDTLQLELNDPFNLLWMEYFSKTAWFNAKAIGRLFNTFRRNYAQLIDGMKGSMRNTSTVMSGKTRSFFVMPQNVQATKELFNVRDDEEIILAGSPDSINNLIEAMKRSEGKTIFFIMIPRFQFSTLVKAGFAFGKNFVNGIEFLSELNKLPVLNSNQMIKAM
jgi:lipopolysaccharide biosynthesis glycosyltransferase